MGMGLGSVNPAGRIDQKYLCTFDSSAPHYVVEQTSSWLVLFRCRTASTPGGWIIFYGVSLSRVWSWEKRESNFELSSLRRPVKVKWSEVNFGFLGILGSLGIFGIFGICLGSIGFLLDFLDFWDFPGIFEITWDFWDFLRDFWDFWDFFRIFWIFGIVFGFLGSLGFCLDF